MKINIKNLKGDSFSLKVEPSDCIIDVKKQISNVKNVPIEKQKIVYKGKAMEDSAILSQVGVKDEDNFVLMNLIIKKPNSKNEQRNVEAPKQKIQAAQVQQNKKQKQQKSNLTNPVEKNIQKLAKLGYDRKIVEQVLKKHSNDIQKALQQLTSNPINQNIHVTQEMKQQVLKALQGNQDLLSVGQNGQIRISTDIQGLASLLGAKNQQLKKMLQQNPNALQDLLNNFVNENYAGEGEGQQNQLLGLQGLQEQEQDEQNQIVADITFNQAEQQAIQRLMALGFTREQVIPAYLACEKNQQVTANMLFNQQDNGDFDNPNN